MVATIRDHGVEDCDVPLPTPEGFADAVRRAATFFAARTTSNDGVTTRPVLLAVSGGADSLALLLLAHDARSALLRHGFDLAVASLDHGLRPEAADEVRFVAGISASLSIPFAPLRWRGWSRRGNLQAAAREARYEALSRHARAIGAPFVLTAHHARDQLETHLMAHEAGHSGRRLAGMRPLRDLAPGLRLYRPLLHVAPEHLVERVRRSGLVPVADPSNSDARFARIRIRQRLADMPDSDRRQLRLSLKQAEAGRERDDARMRAAMLDLVTQGALNWSKDGVVAVARAGLHALAGDLRRDLLSRALTAAGGAAHAPERAALRRLDGRIAAEAGSFAATLSGAALSADSERLLIWREYGRSGPQPVDCVAGEGDVLFDRRFDVASDRLAAAWGPLRVVPLGALGRGNRREATLPVCLDASGEVRAAHASILQKAGCDAILDCESRVGWRLLADLDIPTDMRPDASGKGGV